MFLSLREERMKSPSFLTLDSPTTERSICIIMLRQRRMQKTLMPGLYLVQDLWSLPMEALLGLNAMENGQGMVDMSRVPSV